MSERERSTTSSKPLEKLLRIAAICFFISGLIIVVFFFGEKIGERLSHSLIHPEEYQADSAEVTNRYCENNLLSALNVFNTSPRQLPSREYLKFCTSQFASSISGLNDTYILPTASNPYIVLNTENIMIRPSHISTIEFSQIITDSLWVLTIKTNSDVYRLAFTDLERFEQAKHDISQL